MRKLNLILLLSTLAIAGCGSAMMPGQNEGECDKNPEKCMSVREAHKRSDQPITPIPSDAALQRGEVMRVWVAPMRNSNGVLQNSGHVFLE